jgi:multiple antibiotic resistance protein
MVFEINKLLTVTFTLFAVIDIIGSVPVLISLKNKMGQIKNLQATLVSGSLMIIFLFVGKPILRILGVDVHSFAIGGSIIMFLIGIEMVLGLELFKHDEDPSGGTLVPVAFPLIAGSGTLTTIMSLKANFEEIYIIISIVLNVMIVYVVLISLKWIEKVLGKSGLTAIRKFFGVILLAIAIKIFGSNLSIFKG